MFVAVGVFYYLCVLSYSPVDPSFFSLAGHHEIHNSGGMIGAYLSGSLFFLFGAGSYFIGLYFVVQALLLFAKRIASVRWWDFLLFLSCAVFVAVFLQLSLGQISAGLHRINAGGTIGKIIGEAGAIYLGPWGVYLFAVAGAVFTFPLATGLSPLGFSRNLIFFLGKGLKFFWICLTRAGQRAVQYFRQRRLEKRSVAGIKRLEKACLIGDTDYSIKVNIADSKDFPGEEDQAADPVQKIISQPDDVEPKILKRRDQKPKNKNQQMELENMALDYQLPPLAFLDDEEQQTVEVDKESLKMSARLLESKFKDFAIDGRVTEIHPGPVITMYEFQPAPGVKLSRISSLTDDLSLAMGGRPVRIEAPLPNKSAIGIEIPNHVRETVYLKDIINSEGFRKQSSKLKLALGKDTEGIPYVTDLQKMPHLLVAGSTGSGKSVSLNSMICSILYTARPDEVRLIMIDPKMIELSVYEGIPHLLLPVVTEPKKANLALKWAVREMDHRYRFLADVNVRHIQAYNKKMEAGEYENKPPLEGLDEEPIEHNGKLPYIVLFIDEFADLMMVSSKEVEESVCRLAQKARAAGIHVVLATQRPSVDVITGIIKANFTARIAFRVTSRHDSRTILDANGSEHLLGMGDMLFTPPASSRMVRLHGAYISEKEIARLVEFLKKQGKPVYNEDILRQPFSEEGDFEWGELDEFYDEAVRRVCETRRVSVSGIQRQFRIGYNRAARLVEKMEVQGVVSSPNSQGQREVLAGGH